MIHKWNREISTVFYDIRVNKKCVRRQVHETEAWKLRINAFHLKERCTRRALLKPGRLLLVFRDMYILKCVMLHFSPRWREWGIHFGWVRSFGSRWRMYNLVYFSGRNYGHAITIYQGGEIYRYIMIPTMYGISAGESLIIFALGRNFTP